MGFWSTVLVALRLRSDELPVLTEPLHSFRIRFDMPSRQLARSATKLAEKIEHNVELTHRVRLEAE